MPIGIFKGSVAFFASLTYARSSQSPSGGCFVFMQIMMNQKKQPCILQIIGSKKCKTIIK